MLINCPTFLILTVKQLEDGLRGAKSWIEWRNNIKSRSNNSTENFVDELFNNWQ